MPRAPEYRFAFVRHADGWRWMLRSKNGHDLATSPRAYSVRWTAVLASRRVRLAVAAAVPDGEGRPKADAAR